MPFIAYDGATLGSVSWQGVVPYFTYTIAKDLESTFRLELFSDDQGNRTGFEGNYRTATLGLKWTPKSWLIIRPEIRCDTHTGTAAFEGKNHLETATLDAIVKW